MIRRNNRLAAFKWPMRIGILDYRLVILSISVLRKGERFDARRACMDHVHLDFLHLPLSPFFTPIRLPLQLQLITNASPQIIPRQSKHSSLHLVHPQTNHPSFPINRIVRFNGFDCSSMVRVNRVGCAERVGCGAEEGGGFGEESVEGLRASDDSEMRSEQSVKETEGA